MRRYSEPVYPSPFQQVHRKEKCRPAPETPINRHRSHVRRMPDRAIRQSRRQENSSHKLRTNHQAGVARIHAAEPEKTVLPYGLRIIFSIWFI